MASQLLTIEFFSLSLAMVIAVMVIRNIYMGNVNHMSHECMLNSHYFAEIRLKMEQYKVEIFQNRERNYQHVGKCIAGHRMLF